MGTSSRYNGPTDRNPLLPEGFDLNNYDNNSEPDKEKNDVDKQAKQEDSNKDNNIAPKNWQNAKTQLSKYLNNNGKASTAVASYTKALGGAKNAGMSSHSGKETTRNLGNFLSNVSKSGINVTLKNYSIEFENRRVDEVLSDVINYFSPIPDSKENSIARNAMINTIENLYFEIEKNGGDLSSLDNLSSDYFNNILKDFISDYIYERLMSDLASRIEISTQDIQSIINLEKDLKIYVKDSVENTLKDKNIIDNDFSNPKTKGIIEQLYIDSYEVLEGAL